MRFKNLIIFCLSLLLFSSELNALEGKKEMSLKVKITIKGKSIIANLEDNVTAREFIKRLPLKLPMLDLYGRELVNRLSKPLPIDTLRSDNYAVGDIIYWPPRKSFVILYKQNGERFYRQQVGHINYELSFLDGVGDTIVEFELLK